MSKFIALTVHGTAEIPHVAALISEFEDAVLCGYADFGESTCIR